MPLDGNILAHSPLGASGAERWMNCSGSTTLIKRVQAATAQYVEDDPEWRADGVEAHGAVAYALTNKFDAWQLIGHELFPRMTGDMAVAAQVYLDYVRSREGAMLVEHRMHRPKLHELFYGTLDCALIAPALIEIIDYKHGAGVVVEIEGNVQLMYYANGLLDEIGVADDTVVRMTIVQPNAWHESGQTIRSWETTAGALRKWLHAELIPAMDTKDVSFKQGEWCRFCPAKIACPAMTSMVQEAELANALPYDKVPLMKMLIKAAETAEYQRLMAGEASTGGKLVTKKVDRVWKDGAEDAVAAKFGPAAFTKPTMVSPAVLEKLPEGTEFVSEWAYKPEAGLVVAPITDKRAPMRATTAAELHGALVQKVLTGGD